MALTGAALRVDAGLAPVALLGRLRAAEIGAKNHPLAELEADETGRSYGLKVSASLLLHLPELESRMPLAAAVLLLASLCHPEDIPIALLVDCFEADVEEVREAAKALDERLIVRFDAAGGVDKRGALDVHRLTQSAVRARAGTDAVEQAREPLLRAFNDILVDVKDPRRWPELGEALPHARAWLEMNAADSRLAAALLNQVAVFLDDHGRASEAEPLYEEALAMYRRLFVGNHPDVPRSLNNLGYQYGAQGRFQDALPLHEEAVEMARRCLPQGHPRLVSWEQNLAFVRRRLGQCDR